MSTSIDWLNHAAVLIRSGRVGLMCDPWLFGRVFDRSWEQLSLVEFPSDRWAEVTDIWISHEHPDHFHPPSLRSIPETARSHIRVFYQRTRDGRVVDYLNGLGFAAVEELRSDREVDIGEGVSIHCVPVSGGDSALLVRTPDATLLNVNDCILVNKADVARLAARLELGTVDVLFTQFSYAQWEGTPEEVTRRRHRAASQLDRIRRQIEVLRPHWVIPFASFVWFCHEENAYLNDAVNSVRRATEAIESTGSVPVVLYPGDRWALGESHDNATSIARYEQDVHELPQRELETSPAVGHDALMEVGARWTDARRADNPWPAALALRSPLFPTVHFWLDDLSQAYALDLRNGLRPSPREPHDCDVALSSAALHAALAQDWGGGTLLVNGRFRPVSDRGEHRVRRYWQLALLNSNGRQLVDVEHFSGVAWRRLTRTVRAAIDRRRPAPV